MPYKISSQIYDETKIQIQGLLSDTILFNKLIDLDINGDDTPTFGESRYEYSEEALENFITDIKNDTTSMFLFDQDEANERMDGIMFIATQDSTLLSFNTSYCKNTIAVYMDLTEDKDIIIADLYTLKNNIRELIDTRLEYMKRIENIDLDEEDENDENSECQNQRLNI